MQDAISRWPIKIKPSIRNQVDPYFNRLNNIDVHVHVGLLKPSRALPNTHYARTHMYKVSLPPNSMEPLKAKPIKFSRLRP